MLSALYKLSQDVDSMFENISKHRSPPADEQINSYNAALQRIQSALKVRENARKY